MPIGPPAGNPTIRRSGFDGNACAHAWPAPAKTIRNVNISDARFMIFLLLNLHSAAIVRQALSKLNRQEYERFGKLIKQANIKL